MPDVDLSPGQDERPRGGASHRQGRLHVAGPVPLADAAVDRLLALAEETGIEVDRWTVVVPGGRGGRILLHRLVERAPEAGVPRILTPAALRELAPPAAIDAATLPEASDLEHRLALAAVLAEAERRDRLPEPLLPQRPDPADERAWRAIARRLDSVDRTLAAHGLRPGHVPDRAPDLDPGEADRWRAIDQLVRAAGVLLEDAGRLDRHAAMAERRARPPAPPAVRPAVLLVGVTELAPALRSLLERFAEPVHAVTGVLATDLDLVDDLGVLRSDPAALPEGAVDRPVALASDRDEADRRLLVAGGPEDQARTAVEALADPEGPVRARRPDLAVDDVTLVALDAGGLEPLERHLDRAGVRAHPPEGRPVAATPVGRLARDLVDWLGGRSLAALARALGDERFRAAVVAAQTAAGDDDARPDRRDPRVLIDRVRAETVVDRLAGPPPPGRRDTPALRALLRAVDALLDPLRDDDTSDRPADGGVRPLGRWTGPWLAVLRGILGELPLAADGADPDPGGLVAGAVAVRDVLLSFEETADVLQPPVTAAAALELALEELRDRTVPREPEPGAIEIVGWLEADLDPAPVAVLCGLHDGVLPGGVAADAFLPDGLRQTLGLPSDRSRTLRDAVRLRSLAAGRDLVVVAARSDGRGEPVVPSRLLFRVEERELPRRVRRLSEDLPAVRPRPIGTPRSTGEPLAVPEAPVRPARFFAAAAGGPRGEGSDAAPAEVALSVTAFAAYLDCPYRCLLSRGLRLDPVETEPRELDAARFGSIAHDVLAALDDPSRRELLDHEALRAALAEAFDHEVAAQLGRRPAAAVRVQLSRLRTRLDRFARHEARRRAAGWRTIAVETDLPASAVLDLGAMPAADAATRPPGRLRVKGRIDRVDARRITLASGDESLALRIVDYKTGDRAKDPREVHLKLRGRTKEVLMPAERGRPDPGDEAGMAAWFEAARATWSDLQLPLYRRFARDLLERSDVLARAAALLGGDEAAARAAIDVAVPGAADEEAGDGAGLEVGYVVLPAKPAAHDWRPLALSAPEAVDAVEVAIGIGRLVAAGFAPAPRGDIRWKDFDAFARVCRTGVLEPADDATEDGDGERAA